MLLAASKYHIITLLILIRVSIVGVMVLNESKKRGRYTVARFQWLIFFRLVGRKGQISYAVGFYRTKKNSYATRTISHDEKQAKSIWNTLIRGEVPTLVLEDEKKQWLYARIVQPPIRARRSSNVIDTNLGTNKLAQNLKKYCDKHCNKRIGREAKTRTVKICKSLSLLAGENETLTPRVVKSYFNSRMNPEDHYSPETIIHERTEIKAIARYLGMAERKVDVLFKDVNFPTKSQLKDQNIDFGEKNRAHLERPQVKAFIQELIKDESMEWVNVRSCLWLQLQTAWRPNEPPCAQLLDTSVYLDGTWKNGRKKSLKTASKGVAAITVARDPILDAYLYLTNCKPGPINTKKASTYFKKMALNALGNDAEGLDRYCFRHTALTWMTRSSIASRLICDTAGHMGMRMLDSRYAHRMPKDQRSWEDAMPLNFQEIPKNWKGFLLECVIVAMWPELEKGVKPLGDPRFEKLLETLKRAEKNRKELSLFD